MINHQDNTALIGACLFLLFECIDMQGVEEDVWPYGNMAISARPHQIVLWCQKPCNATSPLMASELKVVCAWVPMT